jgi:hypothetical protein
MLNSIEHPDTTAAYHALKQIQRGSMQTLEDKAIAAYMRAYEEQGREEAEKVFFNHFNKGNNGVDKRK